MNDMLLPYETVLGTLCFAEAPANNMAKHNKKFPAPILPLSILGWLCHTNSFSKQSGFPQCVSMVTIVPCSCISTKTSSPLQPLQNWNSRSSFDRNTIYFGSFRKSLSFSFGLKRKQSKYYDTCLAWSIRQ